jgi:hypothetical protein
LHTTLRTSQFFHSTTIIFETISKHHGVHLKLKIKPRRRRTWDQQQVQEEKDKLGAEPGGEGKLEASHRHQQATVVENNIITAQLQATGRNLAHHITASA